MTVFVEQPLAKAVGLLNILCMHWTYLPGGVGGGEDEPDHDAVHETLPGRRGPLVRPVLGRWWMRAGQGRGGIYWTRIWKYEQLEN